MTSLYDLNQPPSSNPNPFWDFLANLENHPFFSGPHQQPPPYTGPGAQENGPSPQEAGEGSRSANPGSNGNTQFNHGHPYGNCGGWDHPNPHFPGQGYGGFGFGFPFNRPYGPGAHPFGPGAHRGRGRHHCHGRRSGGPSPNHQGAPPFDLPSFLTNLASNLGLSPEQFQPSAGPANANATSSSTGNGTANAQTDFTPPIDIFDTRTSITIHVSLPGAKKSDLSVTFDAGESVLQVAGVIHRPGIDESMHEGLVVSERGEVGVFEREVRLGTRDVPARVVGEEIRASLEEGVLRVVVPRVLDEDSQKERKVEVEVDGDDETEMGDDGGREYVRVDVQ